MCATYSLLPIVEVGARWLINHSPFLNALGLRSIGKQTSFFANTNSKPTFVRISVSVSS
jgi:hypothetical protein